MIDIYLYFELFAQLLTVWLVIFLLNWFRFPPFRVLLCDEESHLNTDAVWWFAKVQAGYDLCYLNQRKRHTLSEIGLPNSMIETALIKHNRAVCFIFMERQERRTFSDFDQAQFFVFNLVLSDSLRRLVDLHVLFARKVIVIWSYDFGVKTSCCIPDSVAWFHSPCYMHTPSDVSYTWS